MPPIPEEFAKWEAEFNRLMNADREDGEWDLSAAMQRTWEEGFASSDDTFAHNVKLDHDGFPVLDPYVFGSFSLTCDFPFYHTHYTQKKIINTLTRHRPLCHH